MRRYYAVLAAAWFVTAVPGSQAAELIAPPRTSLTCHAANGCATGWTMDKSPCWHQFCNWWTYRPLNNTGLCCCKKPCAPCCDPPLYLFFPCRVQGRIPPGQNPWDVTGCATCTKQGPLPARLAPVAAAH